MQTVLYLRLFVSFGNFLGLNMKVAIVLNTSWNIYNFRLGLVRALMEKGHEVHAIAPHDEYSSKLEDLGCVFHKVKMDSRGANPIKDLALTIELCSIYKHVKPDVILQYTIKPNIYGTFAASLLKIPVVNNVCGLGTSFLNKDLVSWIAIKLYKMAFRFPKLIFFKNDDYNRFFQENNIIKNSATDVLPGSVIDLNHFKPAQYKKNKKFTFLLVSRLIHDKGIIEYIDAIKILNNRGIEAKYQLLGSKDTEHRRGIQEEIINDWLDNNVVEYLGSTDDVRPYLQQSDCVVLPSYREGTPKSLIEAASIARPIIATDVAGCNNIVEDKSNGLLCQPKNPEDLADKMEEMMSLDEPSLTTMGQRGRNIAESRFSEQIIIDKYLNSISTLEKDNNNTQ